MISTTKYWSFIIRTIWSLIDYLPEIFLPAGIFRFKDYQLDYEVIYGYTDNILCTDPQQNIPKLYVFNRVWIDLFSSVKLPHIQVYVVNVCPSYEYWYLYVYGFRHSYSSIKDINVHIHTCMHTYILINIFIHGSVVVVNILTSIIVRTKTNSW